MSLSHESGLVDRLRHLNSNFAFPGLGNAESPGPIFQRPVVMDPGLSASPSSGKRYGPAEPDVGVKPLGERWIGLAIDVHRHFGSGLKDGLRRFVL